jgi:hypothetical protein
MAVTAAAYCGTSSNNLVAHWSPDVCALPPKLTQHGHNSTAIDVNITSMLGFRSVTAFSARLRDSTASDLGLVNASESPLNEQSKCQPDKKRSSMPMHWTSVFGYPLIAVWAEITTRNGNIVRDMGYEFGR